ncbi:DUF29 family protein [uncultured Thiohalocapsa sp.]|uniref:DUF29 family protein n=1 Tax=uncultured Thiohalocapsa sp. TaxID=768990 RepID=UPI0025E36E5C|nr:DUF29 family protein [uncultured Thiohalocapsa sp.]
MYADRDLYVDDYHAWISAQAALLRAGRLTDLDAAQLAEALAAMGWARAHPRLVDRVEG